MSLPASTTVLIVGGGPAGTVTALSLVHHGFRDFVIVDAVVQGENTSRAIVMHGATLEALDAFGCGDDIVSQGKKITGVQMRTRSSNLIRPDFASLKQYTRHPYAILIPQIMTEHILGKKLASLGVSVHRPLKVVGMKRNAENTQLTDVSFEDGRVITAKYVVGADGSHSVVRETASINFTDPMGERLEKATNIAQTVLADVTFDIPYEFSNDDFETTLSAKSLFLIAPLPSSFNDYLAANGHPRLSGQIYRVGSAVPVEEGDIPPSPSKEYLQVLVDRFGPYALSSDPSVNPQPKRINHVIWSTRFRSHSAIAESCFTRLGSSSGEPEGGVILLVGDAAHIHPPAGGQGMNLGLRDAIFLGEAMTKHMHAAETKPLSEADAILRDFAAVRHERALGVIGLAKGLVTVMGSKYKDWLYWWLPLSTTTVRNWGMWLGGLFPFVRRKVAWEMSGLGRR